MMQAYTRLLKLITRTNPKTNHYSPPGGGFGAFRFRRSVDESPSPSSDAFDKHGEVISMDGSGCTAPTAGIESRDGRWSVTAERSGSVFVRSSAISATRAVESWEEFPGDSRGEDVVSLNPLEWELVREWTTAVKTSTEISFVVDPLTFGSDWLTEFCFIDGGNGAGRFLRGGFEGGPVRRDCVFSNVADDDGSPLLLLDEGFGKGIVANMLDGRCRSMSEDSVEDGDLPCERQENRCCVNTNIKSKIKKQFYFH